jgi:hypothetical protein
LRYRRGYKRRRYRYPSIGGRSSPNRTKVSQLYGGIDDDIRRLFFELSPFSLKLVFNIYEESHGEGKRKYAEVTYEKWKSKKVEMGGEISERLIQIVPRVLDFDQKYDLIEKLWNRLRKPSTLRIAISPHSGLDPAIQAVMDAIDALGEHEIPAAVCSRLEWLTQDDSIAAKALLTQIADREAEFVLGTLETQLRQLLAIAAQHPDKVVTANRTVTLPGLTVYIDVTQAAPTILRRSPMSNEKQNPDEGKPAPLARRDDDQKPRDLSPIENPNDLLGEALRRMSPKKQEELIGKATDEELRLQVKRKEGQIDHEMAESKVNAAVRAATSAANAGHGYEVRADQQSEHGSVNVKLTNPPEKPRSLADRVGKCFVATACFGDYSHPAVVVLRRFRDRTLRNNAIGRRFVTWYYRNGPRLADLIEHRPVLQFGGRLFLWPIVLIVFCADRLCGAVRHGNGNWPNS